MAKDKKSIPDRSILPNRVVDPDIDRKRKNDISDIYRTKPSDKNKEPLKMKTRDDAEEEE